MSEILSHPLNLAPPIELDSNFLINVFREVKHLQNGTFSWERKTASHAGIHRHWR